MERSGTLAEPSDNSPTPYIKKRPTLLGQPPVGITRPDVGDVDGDGLLDSVTEYWEVAVDRNFGEVSIMRDRAERTAFLYSLGPEFYDLFEACMSFRRECQDFSS